MTDHMDAATAQAVGAAAQDGPRLDAFNPVAQAVNAVALKFDTEPRMAVRGHTVTMMSTDGAHPPHTLRARRLWSFAVTASAVMMGIAFGDSAEGFRRLCKQLDDKQDRWWVKTRRLAEQRIMLATAQIRPSDERTA